MNIRYFFRWRPTVFFLLLLTVLYGVFVPVNLLLGGAAGQRGDQQMSHYMYRGAFWNAVVAILCFTGWRLMRRQSLIYLSVGACAVAVALCIVMRTWIVGLAHGRNPYPTIEAVLTWLPMLYAIIYAVNGSKHET